jgi:D-arabinose 1-dehydrogenase-like Zn-dependent alcohol dehydrogenase
MKAWQFKTKGGNLEQVTIPIPVPKDDEIRIKVLSCGVCHTDIGVQYGALGQSWPRTPGHEVAGLVDEVGSSVKNFKKGDYVGVGWFGGNCGECFNCKKDSPVNCQKVQATGDSFDGGYAEFMTAPANAVAHLPKEVPANEASCMMCGGITTFNSLRHAGAIAGDVVVVQGLGGLGHFGVQWSKKMGYYTVALSRGADKKELALKLGADLYIDSESKDAIQQIQALGGAKVILATAPNSKSIAEVTPALALNGTVLVVALPSEPISVPIFPLIMSNGSVRGWSSGDARDSEDTVNFAIQNNIHPMIDVFPFDQADKAYQYMRDGKPRFRAIIEVAKQ